MLTKKWEKARWHPRVNMGPTSKAREAGQIQMDFPELTGQLVWPTGDPCTQG